MQTFLCSELYCIAQQYLPRIVHLSVCLECLHLHVALNLLLFLTLGAWGRATVLLEPSTLWPLPEESVYRSDTLETRFDWVAISVADCWLLIMDYWVYALAYTQCQNCFGKSLVIFIQATLLEVHSVVCITRHWRRGGMALAGRIQKEDGDKQMHVPRASV